MPQLSTQSLGLLIGGLCAAVLYGLSGPFAKAGAQAGIGTGLYVCVIGLTITVTGLLLCVAFPDRTFHSEAVLPAMGFGVSWALGTACIALALSKYKVPLSKLVPLYNMNTLIGVLLALWIFAEWKQVQGWQLFFGALLMIAGGVLVALA
jgi:drug/metabolite transporter (DMT)-like permease